MMAENGGKAPMQEEVVGPEAPPAAKKPRRDADELL